MAEGRRGEAPWHDGRVSVPPYEQAPSPERHETWEITMDKYICDVCGYIYDPAVGDPDGGIEPGTAFEDIPEDWVCPICGVGKEDFSLYEE